MTKRKTTTADNRHYTCHLCGHTEYSPAPREAFYRHYFEQHHTPAPF